MGNYELANDEVILMDTDVFREDLVKNGDKLHLTLTSKKMIFEHTITKGIFKSKTETQLSDIVMLDSIKVYNGKVQLQQKGNCLYVQTYNKNFSINFSGRIEAMKFANKIIDTITCTTMSDRGINKVKQAINKVDDVLGFDSRDTIKGVLENGIAGTILNGVKKNKK